MKLANLMIRLINDRRGMEMWQLVLIVLAIFALIFILFWYSGLVDNLSKMIDNFFGG